MAVVLALGLTACHSASIGGATSGHGWNGLIGWNVYRHLDLLPEIPVGVQEYEVSSYDRAGGNRDGGPYACLHRASDGCVIAQHTGPGQIDSLWSTRDGGDVRATGRIKVVLDGRTVLDAPLQSVVDGRLGAPFLYPLVANAGQSSGGVYIAVPMPFRHSMRITTQRNPGYYHVFYRVFSTARGVQPFNPSDRARDVLSTLGAAGYRDPKPRAHGARTTTRSFQLAPGRVTTLASLPGPGEISSLRLRLPDLAGSERGSADLLENVRLLISFDGHRTVDSPLGEFFGSGQGRYPVHALMFGIDPSPGGWLSSWWPMPYRSRAHVRLANFSGQPITAGMSRVTSARSTFWGHQLSRAGHAGYFTTTSHAGPTRPGVDWPFLQVRGAGKLVGISQTMEGPYRSYLEGDDIGYIDGAQSPQLHGTGTEDFYEGGWYWNRGPFSDPLNGEPSHAARGLGCSAVCDSAYRLLITDSIPFATSINYGIEHGTQNTVPGVYSSTAFWYQRPNR